MARKLNENPEETPETTEGTKPDTIEKTKDAPPTKPADEDKPVKAVKRKAPTVQRPELTTKPAAPAPVAAPVAPAPTPEAPPSNWEDELTEDERLLLEDARFADSNLPKHKGLAARTEKWLKDHAAFLEKNPDVQDDDPTYVKLLAQRPALKTTDQRDILQAKIKAELTNNTQTELEKIRHENYVREEEPKIRADGDRIWGTLVNEGLPDDLAEAKKSMPAAEFVKAYAHEIKECDRAFNNVMADIAEFDRLTRVNPSTGKPMTPEAQDPAHPKFAQHQRLRKVIDDVCSEFMRDEPAKEGGQIRNGRWFRTREEWGRMTPEQRAQSWTLSYPEIRERALRSVKPAVTAMLKEQRAQRESEGWVRKLPDRPVVAPVVEPKPVSSAPAAPRPSPVPASGSPVTGGVDTATKALADRMRNA